MTIGENTHFPMGKITQREGFSRQSLTSFWAHLMTHEQA